MRRTALLAVLVATCIVSPTFALSVGGPGGQWPKDWPKELEPFRKQAWTWQRGLISQIAYAIPFDTRESFEAVWPTILKLKSEGASITLLRGKHIHVKPFKSAGVNIVMPLNGRPSGQYALTRIELVVDGDIVDLNRIPLPADTPIIDRRFEKPRKPKPATKPKPKTDNKPAPPAAPATSK